MLDKTFGPSHATVINVAWINGASPTAGCLSVAPQWPFVSLYNNIVGAALGALALVAALVGSGIP